MQGLIPWRSPRCLSLLAGGSLIPSFSRSTVHAPNSFDLTCLACPFSVLPFQILSYSFSILELPFTPKMGNPALILILLLRSWLQHILDLFTLLSVSVHWGSSCHTALNLTMQCFSQWDKSKHDRSQLRSCLRACLPEDSSLSYPHLTDCRHSILPLPPSGVNFWALASQLHLLWHFQPLPLPWSCLQQTLQTTADSRVPAMCCWGCLQERNCRQVGKKQLEQQRYLFRTMTWCPVWWRAVWGIKRMNRRGGGMNREPWILAWERPAHCWISSGHRWPHTSRKGRLRRGIPITRDRLRHPDSLHVRTSCTIGQHKLGQTLTRAEVL